MKKNIKKILLLSFVLFIISYLVILFMGKIYIVKIPKNDKNIKDIIVTKETGDIKIIEKKEDNKNYYVKVKSVKPGRANVSIEYDDYKSEVVLYIHKSMVITDNNFFGKSNCSEIIPISISIVLIYTLYLLIKQYKNHIKENLYQYKNIAYLGIIIFLSFFTLNNIISIFNYQGLTVNNIIDSSTVVSLIIFPIAVVTFFLVTISNINLIIKEGLSIRNLLGLILGIFICISTVLPDKIYNFLMKKQLVDIYNLNSIGPYIYDFLETLVYLSIAYLECILIGTIIIAIKSVTKKDNYNKDYIIILGCQIKKDGSLPPLLKGRVDRALEFRNNQLKETGKDLIFIPSGGQGNDEIMPEGKAMSNYLVEHGINKNKILIEDKSQNTYENIKFSNELIKKENANICFSTTNYHVLRAGLIATEQGLKLDGIGSKTKFYFWVNAFIREFVGTLYSEKKKHFIVILIIIILIIMMIGITYLANNI